jgi:hypothetical protein
LIERQRAGNGVMAGKTNVMALVLGGSTLLIILLLKRFLRVPAVLFPVVAGTVAVGVFDLSRRYGVDVLGDLPGCLPSLSLPILGLREIGTLAAAAVAIAVVSFADTSVLSRAYSAKTRAYVDPNQEMIGLGAANLAAGLFQGFPISSSSSRTPVAEASGSKTQLTGLVGAASIALLLLFAPQLLHDLPYTVLAAVVIASAIGLFELADLGRLHRIQRGVLAVSRGIRRRCAPWPGAGDDDCDRNRPGRVHLGWVAAALRRSRKARGHQGLSRPRALSESSTNPGARPLSLGRASLLRQCREIPRSGPGRRRQGTHARPLAGRGR